MSDNAERIYPCDNCGKMRSKDEGGTVFAVCDECWDKHYGSEVRQPCQQCKRPTFSADRYAGLCYACAHAVAIDRIAELEAQLKRHSELYLIKAGSEEAGKFSMDFKSDIFPILAEGLAQLFINEGAENYLDVTMTSDALGPFVLTIQRKWGKTAHELRRDAEAERDEARATNTRLNRRIGELEHELRVKAGDARDYVNGAIPPPDSAECRTLRDRNRDMEAKLSASEVREARLRVTLESVRAEYTELEGENNRLRLAEAWVKTWQAWQEEADKDKLRDGGVGRVSVDTRRAHGAHLMARKAWEEAQCTQAQ